MAKHTKDRLLDAAEELFASQGIAATSVRDITNQAGANVSAVSFHFGGKDMLTKAVFLRRLEPLTRERMTRLLALQEAHTAPFPLDALLDAFIDPLTQMAASGAGERRFLQLFARTLTDPAEAIGEIFSTELSPYAGAFFDAFAKSLPHLSPAEVANRLSFIIGALGHALSDPVRRDLSQELSATSISDEEAVRHLKTFALAGLITPQS